MQENEWKERELALNQKHEEILKRRESILQGTECYYDTEMKQSESFVVDIGKAMIRNSELLEELNDTFQKLKNDNKDPSKFIMLKNNYWTMVRSVFPVWYDDHLQHESRKHDRIVNQITRVETHDMPGNTFLKEPMEKTGTFEHGRTEAKNLSSSRKSLDSIDGHSSKSNTRVKTSQQARSKSETRNTTAKKMARFN